MASADQSPVPHEGSVRMNISVPAELKREMEATKEAVNWSRVAADAFRTHLTELAAVRDSPTMEDVFARLKATAELDAKAAYSKGFGIGEAWAKQTARAKELQRLSQRIRQHPGTAGPTATALAAWSDSQGSSLASTLAGVIHGEPIEDWDDLRLFWGDIIGEDGVLTDVDFARGFIDGALSIWDLVSDRLGMTCKKVESKPEWDIPF